MFVLAATATLCACDPPPPKLPEQQLFNVCMVYSRHYGYEADVTLKGEDFSNLYDVSGSDGQFEFRPHVGTDDGMPRTHYAFRIISPFDRHKGCQDVIGKILG